MVVGHGIDQAHRLGEAFRRQHVEHRQEGRDAGAAGQHQHGARDRPQVEAAERAGEGHRLAGLGLCAQVVAHQAARHVAHDEAGDAGARRGTEGVRAGVFGAGHLHVDVLPRQEVQRVGLVERHREADGRRRQLIDRRDLRAEIGDAGLAGARGGGNPDHAVRGRAHLAGQHVAGGGILRLQRILDVAFRRHLVLPGFAMAAAGAAGAVAAVERDVDFLAVGRVGQFFVGVAADEAGDAVFELQCDRMGHDRLLIPALKYDRCR